MVATPAVTTLNPANVPTPPPTYDQVAIVQTSPNGKLIPLAGQTGMDPETGKVVPGGFVKQVKQAHLNVLNALKGAGATPRDIIHLRHYIVDDSRDDGLNKLDIVDRGAGELWVDFMKEYANGHLPPDTVLGVASLAKRDLLYEIECWAYVAA